MWYRVPIGIFLYLFSKKFRATVHRKLSGADDSVESGETVVAVLNRPTQKEVIG